MKTPENCDAFRLVREREKLLPEDLYLSTSGQWQSCPCPGVVNQGYNFHRLKERLADHYQRRSLLQRHVVDADASIQNAQKLLKEATQELSNRLELFDGRVLTDDEYLETLAPIKEQSHKLIELGSEEDFHARMASEMENYKGQEPDA